MSHAQRLRLRDVRDVGRLVGECRELGADPLVWRTHMVRELSRHCNTQISGATEQYPFGDWEHYSAYGLVNIGYACERERLEHLQVMVRPDYVAQDPAAPAMLKLVGRAWTRLRNQVCDDDVWYRSEHAQLKCKPFRVDSFLTSQFPIPHLRCIHMITLSRPWGERPLGLRECRLVHLLHTELGRLWRAESDPLHGVGARERDVLHHLRNGQSEKEVARAMKLSAHTVHDYVKRLHQHFGVASRGELLSTVNRLRVDFRPRLAVETLGNGGNVS